MDIDAIDQDSPILWVQIDPDMILLRDVTLEQSDFRCHLMALHEKDIYGQLTAISEISHFNSATSANILTDVIKDEDNFWRVRAAAAIALAQIHNTSNLATLQSGIPATSVNLILTEYRRRHFLAQCPTILKKNRFQRNIPNYLIQKSETLAIGKLRVKSSISQAASVDINTARQGVCPEEATNFILDLIKFNDNTTCTFSDCYWLATLVDSLAECLTATMTSDNLPVISDQSDKLSALPAIVKKILNTTTMLFNMDRVMPQYKYVISQSCIDLIRRLMKLEYIPDDSTIFMHYAKSSHYPELRVVAIKNLVDFIKNSKKAEMEFKFLIELAVSDPSTWIRHQAVKCIIENPPWNYKNQNHYLNSFELSQKLWKYIYESEAAAGDIDARHRTDIVDLWFCFYGLRQPVVVQAVLRENNLKNPNDKIAIEPNEVEERRMSTNSIKKDKKRKKEKKDKKEKKKKRKEFLVQQTIVQQPVQVVTQQMCAQPAMIQPQKISQRPVQPIATGPTTLSDDSDDDDDETMLI